MGKTDFDVYKVKIIFFKVHFIHFTFKQIKEIVLPCRSFQKCFLIIFVVDLG